MSVITTDCRLFVAQYNLSGDSRKIQIVSGQDMKEDTVFGATAHTMKPGLTKTSMTAEGFAQSSATGVEDILMANLGTTGVPITIAAEGGDAGESCRFFKGVIDMYDTPMQVGELKTFNVSAKNSGSGDNPQIRGTIFEDGKTSRTTASNTSTIALGAVSATQKLYAVLHVTAFVGTDVTFAIKSAVTDFSTLTTRGTFTATTAASSQYLTPVSGSITDTFWRVYWTTSGGFTSFSAVISLGIQ